MKVLRKQTFRTLFFPPEKPTEKELTVGRRRFIELGAVAAVIYSIATGNFKLSGSVGIVLRTGRHDPEFWMRPAVFLSVPI